MTSAGSTIAISATLPGSETSGAYGGLSYTVLGDVSDLGSFGKVYNEVSFLPLATRAKQKFKGSYDNGTLALKLAKNKSDAGQVIALAALASDNAYAFKVVLQDGTIEFFSGRVMSYNIQVGGTDQITGSDINIGITTNIIEV